jgi:hypothetical protein
MKLVVVPDALSEAIYRRVDEEIAKHPPAAPDRELIYSHILGYFDEHGVIPDFSLKPHAKPGDDHGT